MRTAPLRDDPHPPTERFTLRRRLSLLAAIGVAFVVVVAVAGYSAFETAKDANAALTDLSTARRNHQDGDMMHDAIRGDAYLALLSADGEVGLSEADVRDAVEADAARFRDDLAANRELDLPDEARTALASVKEPLEAYIAEAITLTDLAFRDIRAARLRLPAFDASFLDLQDAQAVVTDTLERLTATTQAASVRVDARSESMLVITIAVAIVVLMLVAWRTRRAIVDRLARLADVARAISRGELDRRASDSTADELGELARAINEMAADLESLVQRMEMSAERDGFGSQLAEALEMADSEDEALQVVERAMSAISTVSPMEILLADSSKAHLRRASEHPQAGAPCCPVESPFACVAVRRGNPVEFSNSEALNACPKLRDRAGGPISAVCVPVTFMGRALGVLHASGNVGDRLSPEAVGQLTSLATQAGARIGTVRSFERSQLQASTDGLTGLRNRRTIETEVRGALKDTGPMTVVLADLDHFKLLNDTYGHEAGDRALRQFAQLLDGSLRSTDLSGRFGGEEFLIAFPGTQASVAVEIIERLRARLEETGASSGLPTFTASFGVVDTHAGRSLDDLLRIADVALYRAKHEGRNRVAIANDDDIARAASHSLPPEPFVEEHHSRDTASRASIRLAAALDDPMPRHLEHR